MVAINMEMQKCCISCQIRDSVPNCPCKGSTLIFDYQDKRHYDCPLVEIVTCKDCSHWKFDENKSILCGYCINLAIETNEDFYCADAEGRE